MKTLVTIVGARPQFVKAAAVSRALRRTHREILVHTGQHYDDNMSEVFFEELDIPRPDCNLGVGGGSHAEQTGAMLVGIERILQEVKPDAALVYGDTNSTAAGALAAAKLKVPVAHVEAGLRSYNRAMPEEINRIVADHLSTLLFCPSQTSADNLAREGITRGVHVVGDVMHEALVSAAGRAATHSTVLDRLGLVAQGYRLVTVHRAENTDDPARLRGILDALEELSRDGLVVFPVHPRTRKAMEAAGIAPAAPGLRLVPPVGYLDMVRLEGAARMILTDSGGIQKEAYWLGVPCVTLRDETEWVETVKAGWNVLAGAGRERIVRCARETVRPADRPLLYGDGRASARIVDTLGATG